MLASQGLAGTRAGIVFEFVNAPDDISSVRLGKAVNVLLDTLGNLNIVLRQCDGPPESKGVVANTDKRSYHPTGVELNAGSKQKVTLSHIVQAAQA